ncbi:hypothetical protein GWI33_010885, partial [Rhynchophorus ferrugineus]
MECSNRYLDENTETEIEIPNCADISGWFFRFFDAYRRQFVFWFRSMDGASVQALFDSRPLIHRCRRRPEDPAVARRDYQSFTLPFGQDFTISSRSLWNGLDILINLLNK